MAHKTIQAYQRENNRSKMEGVSLDFNKAMFKNTGGNQSEAQNQTQSLHNVPEEEKDSLVGGPRRYNFPSTMDTQMQATEKDF